MAEVSYSGNYQICIHMTNDLNAISRSITTGRAPNLRTAARRTRSTASCRRNGGQSQNATISGGSLLTPNSIFQGLANNPRQWVRYLPDALQVTIEKRLLGGEKPGVPNYVLCVRWTYSPEAFNITNTTGYSGPNTTFSSDRFGMLPDN